MHYLRNIDRTIYEKNEVPYSRISFDDFIITRFEYIISTIGTAVAN